MIRQKIPTAILVFSLFMGVSESLVLAAGPTATPDSTRPPESSPASTPAPLPVEPFRLGDTTIPAPADSVRVHRRDAQAGFLSSPTGALLRSVAFPGWGQWSNGKKQKAGVYFGIESYFITKSLIWRHRARGATDLIAFSHARDRRNYFYWLTGVTIFISMFDAYADRYLLTLERTRHEGDDYWGLREGLTPSGPWCLSLTIRF